MLYAVVTWIVLFDNFCLFSKLLSQTQQVYQMDFDNFSSQTKVYDCQKAMWKPS